MTHGARRLMGRNAVYSSRVISERGCFAGMHVCLAPAYYGILLVLRQPRPGTQRWSDQRGSGATAIWYLDSLDIIREVSAERAALPILTTSSTP